MRIVCVLFSLLGIMQTSAQPILYNYYPTSPAVVNWGTHAQADTTGISPDPSGANVEWNYDLVFNEFGEDWIDTFNLPTGLPYTYLFPDANLVNCRTYGNASAYEYYYVTPTLLRNHGAINILNGELVATLVCDDPWDLVFPISYGSSQTDSYGISDTVVESNGDISIENTNGTVTVSYDGFGSLEINNHVFGNVVRLKHVHSNSQSSAYYFPGVDTILIGPNEGADVAYYWYDASNGHQLMYLLNPNNPVAYRYVRAISPISLIAPVSQSVIRFDLIPNPASGTATVKICSNDSDIDYKISLTNVVGQQMWSASEKHCSQSCNFDLPISELSQGVYLVYVENSNGDRATKMLFVE